MTVQARRLAEYVDVGARPIYDLEAFDPKTWTLPPMISSDTHVAEPPDLWDALPERLRKNIPKVNFGGPQPAGSGDPRARVIDQDTDGVGADIMFPNSAMALFALDDPETQFEAMRLYNDFLADFCKTSPKRLFGIPAISVYDIDKAIAEMHRAHDMGLIGIMVWQVPDPKLPFKSDHYEKLWAACAEANVPVHTHILTGHSYMKDPSWPTKPFGERIRNSVNTKQADTIDALYDLIFYGAFERHPNLKLVIAESEMGWIPYILQQWDYYYERFKGEGRTINTLPSELFMEHVLRNVPRGLRRDTQPLVVGSEQRHVVERLPALQHDVPELARQRASAHRQPPARRTGEARPWKRARALQAPASGHRLITLQPHDRETSA